MAAENKKIIIITPYFLPNNTIDVISVLKMCEAMLKIYPKLDIHIVTTNNKYKSNFNLLNKQDTFINALKVHYISYFKINVKSNIFKMIDNMIQGFQLVKLAKKLNINNIICLTSPPLISIFSHLGFKNKNFFYWSFDLFPEALEADNIIKNKFILKFLSNLIYNNPPKNLISLGELQYNYLIKKYGSSAIQKIILPCGIHSNMIDNQAPIWYSTSKINIGYIGNIGRAHNEDFLLNILKLLNNHPNFNIIIVVYGIHAQKIINCIHTLKSSNIQILKEVPQNLIGYIDVHVVSLKDNWKNIAVPSKAVSAVCSGSTIWFCGPKDCDTYQMLNQAMFYSTDAMTSIQQTIENLTLENIKLKKEQARKISKELLELEQGAYQEIMNQI